MPRKHRDPSPSSSSDGEAPEAVTLTQSKQNIQQREHVLQQARLSAKEKEKEKNRELDKKLKERAGVNRNAKDKKKGEGKRTEAKTAKGKKDGKEEVLEDFLDDGFGEGVDFGSEDGDFGEIDPELEARMLKAMRDAEEEQDGSDSEFDEDEDEGAEDGQGFDSENGEEDYLSGEDESEEESADEKGPPKTTHLPDELFKSAFQQSQPFVPPKSKLKHTSTEPPRKRRRTREPKELSAGSKKIRLLPNPSLQPAHNPPSTMPSKKVNKFLDRSLALKGRATKPKLGWERRPANIGLLRSTNGPAAHFYLIPCRYPSKYIERLFPLFPVAIGSLNDRLSLRAGLEYVCLEVHQAGENDFVCNVRFGGSSDLPDDTFARSVYQDVASEPSINAFLRQSHSLRFTAATALTPRM
ncbi:hypothetical protein EST38_g2542 [Candolleomyces aberdarensis]|uniref:Uncharacterized protein n=1 Tax=Candolleomyces aberdarensis TaxID=2316362 RepID=A0A4Q2DUE7_9AGAR|nr:hypothetical protein EST38_g2542 [Candolleomyces aberdarensis]